MAQRRVFISHSAREHQRANEVRQAIKSKLKAEPDQYAVLMDDDRLDPGDAWRSRINLWLGACDAAIVVISPAALTSAYVAFELNILGYRHWSEQRAGREFRIIPLLVDVTMEQVNASILRESQANEWNAVIIDSGTGNDPAACVDQVVDALHDVVPFGSHPIEQLAKALARSLPEDEDPLDLAAAALALEIPFDIQQSKRGLLALRLLHAGMSDDAVAALDQLRGAPKMNLDIATEILSCTWVDLKAGDLRTHVTGADRTPLVLNAQYNDTARMYVAAARYAKDPPFLSHFAETNPVVEELEPKARRAEVIGRVKKALLAELNETEENLALALSDYHRKKAPVFVALQEPSPDAETLADLRVKFPYVTFFVLTGPAGNAARLDDGKVYVIRPPLHDQDEAVCHKQYDDFYRLVSRT